MPQELRTQRTNGKVTISCGLDVGSYRIIESLGSGQYGIAYLGELNRPSPDAPFPKLIAMKFFSRVPSEIDRTSGEWPCWNKLAKLSHQGLVKLFGYSFTKATRLDTDEKLIYAMEYCEGNTLEKTMKDGICWTQVVDYTRQILNALNYLHYEADRPHRDEALGDHDSLCGIHSDLKPANILLCNRHVSGILRTVKIADMDDVVFMKEKDKETTPSLVSRPRGSPRYMAPEMVLKTDPTVLAGRKTDIWSLGCIVYEMAFGVSDKTFHKEIPDIDEGLEQFINARAKDYCDHLREFLGKTLNHAPSKRLPPSSLLSLRMVAETQSPSLTRLLHDEFYSLNCESCKARAIKMEVSEITFTYICNCGANESEEEASRNDATRRSVERFKLIHGGCDSEEALVFEAGHLGCEAATADMRLVADYIVYLRFSKSQTMPEEDYLREAKESSSAALSVCSAHLNYNVALPRLHSITHSLKRTGEPPKHYECDYHAFPFLELAAVSLLQTPAEGSSPCTLTIISDSIKHICLDEDGEKGLPLPSFLDWKTAALEKLQLWCEVDVILTSAELVHLSRLSYLSVFCRSLEIHSSTITELWLECETDHAACCDLDKIHLPGLKKIELRGWKRVVLNPATKSSWNLQELNLYGNLEVILHENVLEGLDKFSMEPLVAFMKANHGSGVAVVSSPPRSYLWLEDYYNNHPNDIALISGRVPFYDVKQLSSEEKRTTQELCAIALRHTLEWHSTAGVTCCDRQCPAFDASFVNRTSFGHTAHERNYCMFKGPCNLCTELLKLQRTHSEGQGGSDATFSFPTNPLVSLIKMLVTADPKLPTISP